MNPGVSPRVVADRVHELRRAAGPGLSGAPRRVRTLVRPVGRVLIRVGLRLTGPEPEHPGLVLHHPRFSR